jgi:enoyl-CoA hydratase/carnithine racemase
MSGRMVDAREAERIGLFERVFAEDWFDDEVKKMAQELAAKPPLALKLAKRTLAVSLTSDLGPMLTAEGERQMRCFRSADAKEGIAAFNEKRKPEFRGE